VAAFSGGFPVGGSFSRTALAKQAGARSRWSAAISSAAVIALLPLIGLIARLPVAVLAAIVMAAVLPLVDVRAFRTLWRIARLQGAVALVTFVATLAFAPHVERGVLAGIGAAIAAHLFREVRLNVRVEVDGGTLHVRPRGVLYFVSAPRLEQAVLNLLGTYPDTTRLVLYLDGLGRVDVTGAMTLRQLAEDALAAGISVEIRDVPVQAGRTVRRVVGDLVPIRYLDPPPPDRRSPR
jgi:SulP family sulfate permease